MALTETLVCGGARQARQREVVGAADLHSQTKGIRGKARYKVQPGMTDAMETHGALPRTTDQQLELGRVLEEISENIGSKLPTVMVKSHRCWTRMQLAAKLQTTRSPDRENEV